MSKLLPINRSLAPAPGGKDEASILERRLQLQESVVGGPSLKRVTDKLRDYRQADKQTRNAVFVALLQEVELYELEIGKATRTIQMYENEETTYSTLANDTQARVQATEKEIRQLTQSVREEKVCPTCAIYALHVLRTLCVLCATCVVSERVCIHLCSF